MTGTSQRYPGAILLAEDEPLLRELGETILRQAGYRVASVSNPDDLSSLLASPPDEFDLLLTDVVMPHMSGQQVANRVKNRWPGIRVIYMSGYSNDDLAGLEQDAGFLQKPFTPAELMQAVQEMIRRDTRE